MSEHIDLGRAIDGIADDAAKAAGPVPVARVLGRMRRRRAARTAATASGTLAVVAAVAVAAVALPRWDGPVPPAQTPTTPSGTVVDVTCGTAMADVAVLDVPPLLLEGGLDSEVLAPDGTLTAWLAAVAHGPGPEWTAEIPRDYRYVVVEDGLVVGTAERTLQQVVSDGAGTHTAVVTPRPCPGGRSGDVLAPGSYDLYLLLPVMVGDERDDVPPDDPRVLVGGPWEFTVSGSPTGDAATADGEVPTAVTAAGPIICGLPMPELVDPPGDEELRIEVGWTAADPPVLRGFGAFDRSPVLSDVGVVHKARHHERVTLRDAPGRYTGVLVDDEGTVVGTLVLPIDASLPSMGDTGPHGAGAGGIDVVTVGRGARTRDDLHARSAACSQDREFGDPGAGALAPGTYRLFLSAGVYATVEDVTAGTPLATVVGGPFPVVVEAAPEHS